MKMKLNEVESGIHFKSAFGMVDTIWMKCIDGYLVVKHSNPKVVYTFHRTTTENQTVVDTCTEDGVSIPPTIPEPKLSIDDVGFGSYVKNTHKENPKYTEVWQKVYGYMISISFGDIKCTIPSVVPLDKCSKDPLWSLCDKEGNLL